MDTPTPEELEKIVSDLASSMFANKRRVAAKALGQLSTSSEAIVRALAIAEDRDEDVDVRLDAREALQSAVHQAFLKEHPDFIRTALHEAIQIQEQKKEKLNTKIMEEFLRRRSRERGYYLFLFCGLLALCGLLGLGVIGVITVKTWMVRTAQIMIILYAFLMIWLSWRNWRCPACDSWLGGFVVGVNPIWNTMDLKCPRCGARLL